MSNEEMENCWARLPDESNSKAMEISRMERAAQTFPPFLFQTYSTRKEREKCAVSFAWKFGEKKAHKIHKLTIFRDTC